MVARLRQPGGGSATVTGEAVVEAAAFALAMVRHVHATVAGMSAR
jgi:hypothetical protein